ncbi:MAG: O-antigen ligase family protein [Kiritimatiellia bacterium]
MKVRGAPFPLAFLLLLLGGAAWNFPGPVWLLPGVALVALAGCLALGGVPARIGVAGGLWLGLIALYAWNASHGWADGRGLVPREHLAGWPASAFPAGTWSAFRLALAAFAAFVLGATLSRRQIRWLPWGAAAAGAAMALAVLMQRLEPNPWSIYERTGIFVNENHFAAFSNLLLPVVLGAAARARFRAGQEGKLSSPAGLFLLVAALMAAAVVLCRSRAGVAVMALLVAAHVGLGRRTIREYPFAGVPMSVWLKGLAGLSVAAAAGFAVRAFWREWRHLEFFGQELTFRSGILTDALAAWREQPAWGIGPGTFSVVFPYYQSAAFAGRTIRHAHCEPVQFLVEFGVAGALAVLAAAALAFSARGGDSAGPADFPPFAELERPAFSFGLLACGLHGLIDFPLRIPLIALIAATWAGAWVGTRPAAPGISADPARSD